MESRFDIDTTTGSSQLAMRSRRKTIGGASQLAGNLAFESVFVASSIGDKEPLSKESDFSISLPFFPYIHYVSCTL